MSKKSTRESKRSARERLRAERERQAAIARRRDRIVKAGIAGVVVVTLAVIGGLVWWQGAQSAAPAQAPAGVVAGADGTQQGQGNPGMGNGVGVGDADAPVTLELFEDFLCPHCASFEQSAGETITQFVESGDLRVVRYPVTLPNFGEPSRLAANAYGCAADEGQAEALHQELYIQSGTQWTNDELLAVGEQVGLSSDSFESCVQDGEFEEWVDSIQQTASERGVDSTPTMFFNNEHVQLQEGTQPAELVQQQVEQRLEQSGDTGQDGGGQDDGGSG